MDSTEYRTLPRRRRRKTKTEIIKENYLPYIFLLVTLVLVVIFVAGSLIRRTGGNTPEDTAPPADSGITAFVTELPQQKSAEGAFFV